ncbi:PD-(D/E)XK nuclease family protein [Peptoanaerobacter stomatis]
MLKIVTARAYSGKTTYIMDEIKKNINDNTLSYLMAPEQLTLETEQMIINTIKKPIFLCKVMSFERLSAEVLSRVGGLKKEYIDDVGKIMLAENILLKNKEELNFYKNSINKSGFLENIIKIITELKKYEISSKSLSSLSTKINDKVLSQKLKDVAKIYDLLEEKISDKFVDNESRLNLLCEKIPEYTKNKKFKIYFDNFVSFTQLELNVIESLLSNEIDITMTLTYDDTYDSSFDITKKTLESMIKIADKVSSKYEIIHLDQSYNKIEDLKHLEENFGKFDFKKYSKIPQNISLIKFDKARTEIMYLANQITMLIRQNESDEKKYRYKDMAVVVTDSVGYAPIIKEIFDMYDIPYFIDTKRNITQENIVNMLFSFLDMFVKSPNHSNIMSFFKSGMSDIKKEDYEIFENFLIRWNMDSQKFINIKFFDSEKYFNDISDYDRERICYVKDYIMNLYSKYKQTLSRKNKVKVFSQELNRFFKELNCQQKLENLVEELKLTGNYEIASEISQIWNILLSTLDKVNNILDDYEISVDDYKKMLYQGLSTQKIALIPPTMDGVMIMDIQRSKSLGYKVLFAVGMNDTLLPQTFKQDVIFAEQDKKILLENDINMMSTSVNMLSQENTALYIILSNTREKLYLTYNISDVNEQSAGKSSYLHTIENIFPNLKTRYISSETLQNKEINSSYFDNITHKVAFAKLKTDLRDMISNRNFDEDSLKLYYYFLQDEEFSDETKALKNSLFKKNDIEKLKETYVQKLYNLPLKSSISQIQTYVKCPFSYYMNYGIRPQKRQKQKVDSLNSGNILHKYMDNLSKQVLEDKNISILDSKEKINRFVDKIYDEEDFLDNDMKMVTSNSKRQFHIIKNLKKISKKATEIIMEQQKCTSFITESAEYKIKDIKIDINDDKDDTTNHIILRGIIDRVDKLVKDGKTYLGVVDYKSSVKKLELKDVYQGINIQMIFYLYALTKKDEKYKDANPYYAMYFPMIDSKIALSEEDFEQSENGEKIKKEHLRQKEQENMKMAGIITDDINMIKSFENDIEGKSKFLDVRVKTDKTGESIVTSQSVVSEEDMKKIIDYVINIIKISANEILKGNIKPLPVKEACEYCDYKNICEFDESIDGFEYKKIKKLNKKEVLDLL